MPGGGKKGPEGDQEGQGATGEGQVAKGEGQGPMEENQGEIGLAKGNTVEYYFDLGTKAGLKGTDLTKFVADQQANDREERYKRREHEKEMGRIALERKKLDNEHELVMLKNQNVGHNVTIGSDELNSSGFQSEKTCIYPKLPKFNGEKDNIDAYILRFERYAHIRGWHKEQWAISLGALLDGKALDVYSRLPLDHANDYERLKKALLTSFNLDEDGFRSKFFSTRPSKEETFAQYVSKIENYFDRWIQLSGIDHSFENLRELIIKEQCLHNSDSQLATFVKEHEASTLERVIDYASLFEKAHNQRRSSQIKLKKKQLNGTTKDKQGNSNDSKGDVSGQRSSFQGQRFDNRNRFRSKACHECGVIGHFRKDCPRLVTGNAAVTDRRQHEVDDVGSQQQVE